MQKSTFQIKKMDCAAEEQLVRMKLDGLPNIKKLIFDLPNRKLEVLHSGDAQPIITAIHELKLGDRHLSTEETGDLIDTSLEKDQRKILKYVLFINASFFMVELTNGILANSMGLMADSLDMLADAIVFGISLFVVGKSIGTKKNVAKISGWFQLSLALLGIIEVVKRFLGFAEIPDYHTMMFVSFFALIGNAVCLYLIQKTASKQEVHIQAGKIFLSNDVIINIGVITAGALVLFTSSKLPDLIVGSIVFIIVAIGAFRILRLSK